MANAMEMLELQPSRMPETALARTLAVLVSLGCLASSLLLAKVVPIFGGLFTAREVHLPFATRFLFANHGWISALFVSGAVGLPAVAEFLISATRVSQQGRPGKIITTGPCH